MKHRDIRLAVFGVAAAICGVGCNSSSSNGIGQCTPPKGTQTVLVYPAPGATGIPDTFSVVVFGSSSTLPTSFQAFVVNNTTGNAAFYNTPLGPAPNPLPTPAATPSFANPVYQSSGNPGVTWVPGSSISVFLNNTGSSCVPTLNLGTFTVQ